MVMRNSKQNSSLTIYSWLHTGVSLKDRIVQHSRPWALYNITVVYYYDWNFLAVFFQIHCLDESDIILTFRLQLDTLLHGYTISLFVWIFSESQRCTRMNPRHKHWYNLPLKNGITAMEGVIFLDADNKL